MTTNYRLHRHIVIACIGAIALTLVAISTRILPSSRPPGSAVRPALAATVARAGLMAGIVANEGQADARFPLVSLDDQPAVLFGPTGLSVRWSSPSAARRSGCGMADLRADCLAAELAAGPPPDRLAPIQAGQVVGDALRGTVQAAELRFVGARVGLRPEAEAPTGATFSRFSGPRASWQRGLPIFRRVMYRDVWPGIDVAWEDLGQGPSPRFLIHPGARQEAIRLEWLDAYGARDVDWRSLDVTGRQHADGAVRPVLGRMSLGALSLEAIGWESPRSTTSDGHRSRSANAAAGPSTSGLSVLAQAGGGAARVTSAAFIGTPEEDRGLGVALGPDDYIYVCGRRGGDAFVAKLTPDGASLVWLAVIDGNDEDAAFDIVVDGQGAAYVTGTTHSADGSFPTRGGPDLTWNGGSIDGFVAKLTPDGSDMAWAGFFGGAAVDFGEGIAVDALGQVTITGIGGSTERTFPVKVGPDLTHNGSYDAWVGRLKADPTAPEVLDNYLWSGFIGGAGDDVMNRVEGSNVNWSCGHVALDAAGNAYLSGETTSDERSFPDGDGFGSLASPDRTYNGGQDAWVVKVRADGSGLEYAGYIGGSDLEKGKGMAVDARGAAWLTGQTFSNDFPIVGGPRWPYGGEGDIFVSRVRPDGSGLEQSFSVGGDDWDSGQAVALAPDGGLVVAGAAESMEDYLPVKVGPDLTHNGPVLPAPVEPDGDVLVGRLAPGEPNGVWQWDFLGFIGGADRESAYWVKVARDGRIIVAGDTMSGLDTFPDGQGMGLRPHYGQPAGQRDAFVAVVEWRPPRPVAFLPWAGRAADGGSDAPPVAVSPGPSASATATRMATSTATPPTLTPVTRPTPSTGMGACESLAFFDDFADPASGWRVRDEESQRWQYVDGVFEVRTATGIRAPIDVPGVTAFRDGAIEADVQIVAGPEARAGLLFGPSHGDLAFLVTADSRFEVIQQWGGSYRNVVPLTRSPAIRPLGQTNRLRAALDGMQVGLFVNGEPVATLFLPAIGEPGEAGLVLRPRTAEGVARFDNVVVTRWMPCHVTATALPPTASPTATRATTRTPTPAPKPTRPGLIFEDDFSNPGSGWTVEDTDTRWSAYVEGEYELGEKVTSRTLYAPAPRVRCNRCAIETDVRLPGEAFAEAGLTVWEDAGNARLYTTITSDGRIALYRFDATRISTVSTPAPSSLVRSGRQATNRLRAERRPGSLRFLVNGGEVFAQPVNTYDVDSRIGLNLFSRATPGAYARFDNVEVWRLDTPLLALSWNNSGD